MGSVGQRFVSGPTYDAEVKLFGRTIQSIGGRSIRTIVKGPPPESAKASVLFIHGTGGRAAQFRHQFQIMEKSLPDFRLLSVDMQGHGESDRPTDSDSHYTPAELTTTLLSFLQEERKEHKGDGPHSLVLVGHSLGTLLALLLFKRLCLEAKDAFKIHGLCLAGGRAKPLALPGWMLSMPAWILEIMRPLFREKSNQALFFDRAVSEGEGGEGKGEDECLGLKGKALETYENNATSQNPMFVIRALGRGMSASDMWKQEIETVLDLFQPPNEGDGQSEAADTSRPMPKVFLAAGRHDSLCPPSESEEMARILRERMGRGGQKEAEGEDVVSVKVYEDCAHNFFMEASTVGAFSEDLVAFVNRCLEC
uniref:AB hydrolase-1 domain-containing protein n=1 Tax=Chromera velia CCMP2878 TaxID=1169474 RepID=A0A0G4I5E2_9ALVE|eukprot:Cvel_11153.t1-p1 / transcript=Cvel_11153.t1 / gene=Cvel_11153 / organism=Chromera_velia_CCMP2878 / gene_product=hypothetical protein / transcript_product=hypothetical protein / location=Cvel_scaffold692:5947-7041(-) / protein_length=365 / sequence_SO=supercontig / SO=protein_coding / is_pseudo=false